MATLAVALGVAAIPEGLAVSLTAILAVGMRRLLKRKALVHKLAAAETARIPVQVNGKTRVIIEIEMEKSKNQNLLEQIARKNPSVVRHLAGKKEKQVIFVPGKILNFVVE